MKFNLHRCLLAAFFAVCASSQAYADGFDVRQFYPIAGSEGVFSIESTKTLKHLDFDIKAMVDSEKTPLKFSCGDDCTPKLEHLVTMNVSAALGVLDFLEVGIVLPFVVLENYNYDFDYVPTSVAEPEEGIFGDMQVRAKGTILKREDYNGFGLGAGVIIGIPTGNQDAFIGSPTIWGRPYISLDYEIGPVEMMLNTGFTIRKKAQFLDYTSSHAFNYGFGINYHVIADWLDLRGEIYGETPLSDKAKKKHQNSAEFLAGAKVYTPIGLNFTAGAGAGIGDGVKNPLYHVIGGMEYAPTNTDTDEDGIPDRKDACVDLPGLEEFEGCPNPDADNDHWCDPWLIDAELGEKFQCRMTDVCPNDPGLDTFEGCPDPDNDNDRWCDAWITDQQLANKFNCKMTDLCADLTGLGDFEGCPDPDSDKDGWCEPWVDDQALAEKFQCKISDKCPDLEGEDEYSGCPNADKDEDGLCASFVAEKELYELYFCSGVDKCPKDPEDLDDFEDEDGCPEVDNDHDGICDPWVSEQNLLDKYASVCRGVDKCPLEPETINGVKDDDGCPDKGKQIVFVHEDKIEIRDKIYFDNNKATIKKKSNSLLDQIAASIRANPDIKHISVEGHTDDTGKYEHNLILSRQRAQAVVDALISRGIAPERLGAIGYGPDKPLDPAKTSKARALNRRVEFVITERGSASTTSTVKPAKVRDASNNADNKDAAKNAVKDAAKDATKDAAKDATKDAAKNAAKEAATDAAKEAAKAKAKPKAKDDFADAFKDMVKDMGKDAAAKDKDSKSAKAKDSEAAKPTDKTSEKKESSKKSAGKKSDK